jgi:hypothetical protein
LCSCFNSPRLLDDASGIVVSLESGIFNRERVQHAIENTFDILCGDLPGAVTVRHSEANFKELRSGDHRELDTLALDKFGSQEDKRLADCDLLMDQIEGERDNKTSIVEAPRSNKPGP